MPQHVFDGTETGPESRVHFNNMLGEIYGTYIRAVWFEEISAGTSGTLTAPTGSAIVLNAWDGGVDCLVSEMSGASGLPSYSTAYTAGGVAVTGTLDVDGNWTLSGTPASYPVALIYVYRIPVPEFDDSYSLETATVEPAATGAELLTSVDLSGLGSTTIDLTSWPLSAGQEYAVAVTGATDTATPKIQVNGRTGGTDYYYSTSSATFAPLSQYDNIRVFGTSSAFVFTDFDICLHIFKGITGRPYFLSQTTGLTTTTQAVQYLGGRLNFIEDVTSLTISVGAGTFTSGNIKVYRKDISC